MVDQLHAPAALAPGKRDSTKCTGGCEEPRAGLDDGGHSRPYWDSISDLYMSLRSVRHTVGLNKAMSERRNFRLKTPIICNVK